MTNLTALLLSLPLSAIIGFLAQRWWRRRQVAPPTWVVLIITSFTEVLVFFADRFLRPMDVPQELWLAATLVMVILGTLLAYVVIALVQLCIPDDGTLRDENEGQSSFGKDERTFWVKPWIIRRAPCSYGPLSDEQK